MSMWKIILIVNLAVYILSFIIPSGAYQRDGKMAVPGTYAVVDKTYLNPIDVILAVGDTVYLLWPAVRHSDYYGRHDGYRQLHRRSGPGSGKLNPQAQG